VARGKGLGRNGARAGDELLVSGTIGDAALGLLAARRALKAPALEKRYRLPQPRTTLGPRLIGVASATADISDGLLADTGHIADASRLSVHIERDLVPLSAEAKRVLATKPALWPTALGGGDDYELAIAVSPRKRARLLAAARAAGVKVTCIGAFAKGRGVVLTVSGHAQRAAQTGYTHF
jgi:thiamine-monophosphate kinase